MIPGNSRIFAVCILAVAALPCFAQQPESTVAEELIYGDARAENWQSWSWGSRIDWVHPTNPQAGTACMRAELDAWGAVSLYRSNPVSEGDFEGITFYLRTDGSKISLNISVENTETSARSGNLLFTQDPWLTGGAADGVWRKVNVAFRDLPSLPSAFHRIHIGNSSGSTVGPFYLDSVRLVQTLQYDIEPGVVTTAGTNNLLVRTQTAVVPAASIQAILTLTSPTDFDYAKAKRLTFSEPGSVSALTRLSLPHELKEGHRYTLRIEGLRGEGLNAQVAPFETNIVLGTSLASQVPSLEPTHSIAPTIYGMAFAPDADYIRSAGVTVNRWGGNHTSAFNWQIQATNIGHDWYFVNTKESVNPVGFIRRNAHVGAATQWSLACLPWVAKDTFSYSFSVSKYGPQQKTEPWTQDIGNGKKADGSRVINDHRDALLPNRPARGANDAPDTVYQDAFLNSLKLRFGPDLIQLMPWIATDNEMDIWDGTHADAVHEPLGFEAIRDTYLEWAGMIRHELPGVQLMGPVSTGWFFFWNAAKSGERGKYGMGLIPFFLQSLRQHEEQHGIRLLDVLDLHYYPEAGNSDGGPADRDAWRLRSTQEWWNPDYQAEGSMGRETWWAPGEPNQFHPQVIPRMRQLIDAHYPGTRLAFTEWNFGNSKSYAMSEALAIADTLGVFGREQVDYSTFWTHPKRDAPSFQAFKIFRNPDDLGTSFGNWFVPSDDPGTDMLTIYSSVNDAATRLHVILVHKDPENHKKLSLQLPTEAIAHPQVFRFDPATPQQVVSVPEAAVSAGSLHWQILLSPWSVYHLVFPLPFVDTDGDGLPDAWERLHGTDPFVPDASLDSDNDGFSNLEEFHWGSDPNHAGKSPLQQTVTHDGNRSLRAQLPYGRTFAVQSSADGLNWQNRVILPGTDGLMLFPIPSEETEEGISYRVVPYAPSNPSF